MTGEKAIRTAYFLKRGRLQSKPRLNEKPEVFSRLANADLRLQRESRGKPHP